MEHEVSASSQPLPEQLFKNIKFYLAGNVPEKVLEVLEAGGAEKLCYFSDFVTHMICGDDPNENDLSSARELYEIPALRWQWVIMSLKLNRLVDTKGFVVSEINLFYKMRMCFSSLNEKDIRILWGLVTYHGGVVQLDLTADCTHLITTVTSGAKYEKALQAGYIKLVTPDWILQSVNKKVVGQYDAYHPRLLIVPPPPQLLFSANPTAHITGFDNNESSVTTTTTAQTNQALLDQLKQRMPWNQPTPSEPPSTNLPSPRLQTNFIQQPNMNRQFQIPAKTPVTSNQNLVIGLNQNKMVLNQNLMQNTNQQLAMRPDQGARLNQQHRHPHQMVTPQQNQLIINPPALSLNQQSNVNFVQQQQQQPNQSIKAQPNIAASGVQVQQQQHGLLTQPNSGKVFRPQLAGATIHHQMSTNQLNQQHIEAGLQRQHMLQNSITQQQMAAQQLDTQANQKVLMADSSQVQVSGNFITKNQLQEQIGRTPPQQQPPPSQQNQKLLMQTTNMLTNQQIQPLSQQQIQLQNTTIQQQQGLIQGQMVQHQVGQPQLVTSSSLGSMQRLPTNPIQRQQILNAQQTALNNKQLANHQVNLSTNDAMLKQQRLLHQQQQQLRIQNTHNNQFVNQQQALVNRQSILPTSTVKPGGGQIQFVQQGQQTRPLGWQQQQQQAVTVQQQQQQQQQVFLQHRQQGLSGTIQRPPNWATGQQGTVVQQRQLIHLDAQTNAQLQQMDPQQRAQFVQKIQKQRQLLLQRQGLQAQQPHQQLAVIRGQVVAGQTQNGQWQQTGPRTPTLVVQQNAVAPNVPGGIRLPPKSEEVASGEQSPLVVNPKTKTALANMLSIRLQSGAPTVEPSTVNEPSAAGTLSFIQTKHEARLMTAQHNAALQQQQQRRTLNNGAVAQPPGGASPQTRSTQQPPTQPSAPITGPPRAHFYGHNPNLKLPPNLFLLGCVFCVVEVENFLNEERPTWQSAIRKHGGEIEMVYCSRVTHVLCQSQKHGVVMQALRDTKRCVTMYWLNDVLKRKHVAPPWLAIHLPTLYPDESPGGRHLVSTSGFNSEEKEQIKLMIGTIGARYTCYFSKHNTVLICAKPEGDKFNLARKCGIPVLNVQWLSDIMLGNLTALNQMDHLRYQQFNVTNPFSIDYNLNPVLMHGWKMPINIRQESYERVKRTAPTVTTPKLKKIKPEVVVSHVVRDGAEPRVLFSQVPNVEMFESIVGRLGGSIASSAKTATHLIMPKLSRSYKLVQCVARGAHILPESWLKDCDSANKFVSETNHTFSNVDEFNKTFNCDFNKLVTCKDREKLYQSRIFYMTPSVFPPKPFLKEMIELSGGTVETNRRSFNQIEELNGINPQSYLILTHKDDLHLINDCLITANSDKRCIVYNTEFVLSGILKQKLLFGDNQFAVVINTT